VKARTKQRREGDQPAATRRALLLARVEEGRGGSVVLARKAAKRVAPIRLSPLSLIVESARISGQQCWHGSGKFKLLSLQKAQERFRRWRSDERSQILTRRGIRRLTVSGDAGDAASSPACAGAELPRR
jgi:hypothetical protein